MLPLTPGQAFEPQDERVEASCVGRV